MITAQRAFQGQTSSDIMAAILRDEVGSTEDSGVSIPLQLEKVVRDCLKKNPEQRPQSAREVRAELKAALGAAETGVFTPMPQAESSAAGPRQASSKFPVKTLIYALGAVAMVALLAYVGLGFLAGDGTSDTDAPVRSLAILPFQFEELTEAEEGTPRQLEYLSKEVVESLINRLSEVEELQVMAWSTVQSYQGEVGDPLEVGRELQVDAVLTGRVSKGETTVTVQATLLDTRQGFQIWGDRFEEPFRESADFQEQVAINVVERLGYDLPASIGGLETDFHPDPEALTYYLEARHKQDERRMTELEPSEIEEQLQSYRKALDIDADFLKARQGMAELLSQAGTAGHLDPKVAFPMAKDAAMALVEMEKANIQTHTVLANVSSRFERDWERVEEQFEKALEMNPRSVSTLQRYAMDYLVPTAQLDEAKEALRRALRQSPRSAPLLHDLGRVHYYQRQYEAALVLFRRAGEQGLPELIVAQWSALALVASDDPEGAVKLLEGRLEDEPRRASNPTRNQALAVLGLAYARAGRTDQAERALSTLQNRKTEVRRMMFAPPAGRNRRREARNSSDPPPAPRPPRPASPPTVGSGASVGAALSAAPPQGLVLGQWGSKPYWLALVHLGLGQQDQAMQLLTRAVRSRAVEAVYMGVDPILDVLRPRDDFEELIDELDLGN